MSKKILLFSFFVFAAHALIEQHFWANTALGPIGAEVVTQPQSINLSLNSTLSSVRYLGFFTLPAATPSQSLSFAVLTDACDVKVWLDDHLLLSSSESCALRLAPPHMLFPSEPGQSYSLRLDGVSFSTLQLQYSGNFTAPAPVPGSVLTPGLAPGAQQRRWDVRNRLETPRIPWQTWVFGNIAAHVHFPDGFTIPLALHDNVTGETYVIDGVPRRFSPAWVRPGDHSLNGSDYTLLNVSMWKGLDCSVHLESTVVGDGNDLLLLATPAPGGKDCARLALQIAPTFSWHRAGQVTAAAAPGCVVGLPGGAGLGGGYTLCAVGGGGGGGGSGGAAQLLLPLGLGAQALYTGASSFTLGEVQTLVAAAAARQAAVHIPFGSLSDAHAGMHAVLAWNTMYTPFEGVITPISRTWDFGGGYVLFEWDTYFACLMLSGLASNAAEGGGAAGTPSAIALDLAVQNYVQMTLGRTLMGHVPNELSGLRVSIEITEPYVAAQVLRDMLALHGEERLGWLVVLMWPYLARWMGWLWDWRRAQGVLPPPADLLTWGANAFSPPRGDLTPNLQVARYESGLDNSPLYDAPGFNSTSGLMGCYDVGASGIFTGDVTALLGLAALAGAPPADVAELRARRDAVSAALNTHLWSASSGMYVNRYAANGAPLPNFAPTNFFPLLDGVTANASQVAAAVAFAAGGGGFCLNSSGVPLQLLHQFWSGTHDNAACASSQCIRDQVISGYTHFRVEAGLSPVASGAASVPLFNWFSASHGDNALTATRDAGPDASYAWVSEEGFCAPSAVAGAWDAPLSLWFNAARGDYQTCGTAACLADTEKFGYVRVGAKPLCFGRATPSAAFNTNDVAALPCAFGFPSIARSDSSFYDNAYWRGRSWGPHAMLMYWALEMYAGVEGVAASRAALVAQSLAAFRLNWGQFGHVFENYNSIFGAGADVGDADPWYHWGALTAFLSLKEAGLLLTTGK